MVESTPAPTEALLPSATPTPVLPDLSTPTAPLQVNWSGEPAGCQPAEKQSQRASLMDMLEYADQLAQLSRPFSHRILPQTWNALTGSQFPDDANSGAVSLSVGDIQPKYLLQRALNALQVAGFVTWLRRSDTRGLHILAVPLNDAQWAASPWSSYIRAYWQGAQTLPEGDPDILPVLKLPPCRWMVAQGFAPEISDREWGAVPGQLDYAGVAQAYLADSNDAAIQVARRINWLGDAGREGPNTMCGPLAWAIMNDAGALPPGFGGWSEGPKSFWLAKPTENGRPWSLFPRWMYHAEHYATPLGTFDFKKTPLYPGDFLYTYSAKDGFDHMLVVTEVDTGGNVYTVTNVIQVQPVKQTTIQRVLLLNLHDQSLGIARNQWAKDGINGRTGHHGFDIFRWAWAEKDNSGRPARYEVEVGDTLGLVAQLWKTPADLIARYNGIEAGTQLASGQVLRIPPNAPANREANGE